MNKDWTGNKRSVFAALGVSDREEHSRSGHDFYATDPKAVDALLRVERIKGAVWECACGAGHLSKRLEELGYKVISSDLYDYGFGKPGVDFLAVKQLFVDNIITNPPYKYALEFVEHALELNPVMTAMFLKITFLEGQKRRLFFNRHPPAKVAVFSERIQVAINGDPETFKKSSAACYAWFIWKRGFTGAPEIAWV